MRLPWFLKEREERGYMKFSKDPLWSIEELKCIYLSCEDLTEYLFINKLITLGLSKEDWSKALLYPTFSSIVEQWRSELEIKLKAEALQAIIEESRLGGKNSYQAKLFLINKGWISKEVEVNRRGRPSKEEINRIAHEEAMSNHQVDDDLKKLRELN